MNFISVYHQRLVVMADNGQTAAIESYWAMDRNGSKPQPINACRPGGHPAGHFINYEISFHNCEIFFINYEIW